MTSLQRKLFAFLGQSLVKNKCLKYEFFSMQSLCFSNVSVNGHDIDYRLPMWKRLKKNDPDIDVYLNSSHIRKRIKELSTCMECSVEEACELIKRDSPIGVTDLDRLQKRIELFKAYNYSTQDILANPSALHRAYHVLETRLATLEILECTPNQTSLSLLKKSDQNFRSYVENLYQKKNFLASFSSKENFLADLLDCDLENAKVLLEEQNLDSLSCFLLKKKIDILKDFGFSGNIIERSLKALVNTAVSQIENRLQVLKDENLLDIPNLKLSNLLLCKKERFEENVASLKDKYTALEGCKTKKEYLIFRLNCSDKVAEDLVSKRPINFMNELKLQKMLSFFLDEVKASSDFVISNTFLFSYSIERFQQRWPLISSSGHKDFQMISKLLRLPNKTFKKSVFTS